MSKVRPVEILEEVEAEEAAAANNHNANDDEGAE